MREKQWMIHNQKVGGCFVMACGCTKSDGKKKWYKEKMTGAWPEKTISLVDGDDGAPCHISRAKK